MTDQAPPRMLNTPTTVVTNVAQNAGVRLNARLREIQVVLNASPSSFDVHPPILHAFAGHAVNDPRLLPPGGGAGFVVSPFLTVTTVFSSPPHFA